MYDMFWSMIHFAPYVTKGQDLTGLHSCIFHISRRPPTRDWVNVWDLFSALVRLSPDSFMTEQIKGGQKFYNPSWIHF